ncbi:MAG: SprT-like domain-containing protein [Chitinophagaceae bacterium]
MSKREAPLHSLAQYLPPGCLDLVLEYLVTYKVHLTITRERRTVLGDYRQPDYHRGHRISINGNLNPYSFLLTLLHEIGHLVTYMESGPRVSSHGKEWKNVFGRILSRFLGKGFLPEEVEQAVLQSIHHPAASSCGDEVLTRVLKKFDQFGDHYFFIEELAEKTRFRTKDGRVFIKGKKIRKRFRCEEQNSGRIYLFSPVYEVEKL